MTVEHTAKTGSARRRRWLAALVVTAALIAVALVPDERSAVGQFTSASGHDRFTSAYDRAMADLPEPSATLDLRTSYGVVRMYRFDGEQQPDAPPLLLLPGRASASPVWADNLRSLQAQRTVYTVDLLGEPGASIQSRPITDDTDQAAWLHEALAQLPERRLHLLGVSFGGWTAMNLAIRRPAKVASVTLLDPVLTFSDMSPAAVVRSIPASVPWFPKSWRDDFNSWTAGGAPVEDVPVADMIEAGMQHYRLELPTPTRFGADQLRSVDVPVLAIMAGESVMHDSADAADVARRTVPRTTVHVYPRASHAINGEYPRRIARDLAGFHRTVD